jgi:hypothetical protein
MARPRDPAERARIVAAVERKEKTQRAARWTGVILVAILVIAGAAYGISKLPKPPQQVHWHATYEVFVEGKPVVFNQPQFFFDDNPDARYLAAHIHQCNPQLIHNEGKEGEGTLTGLFNIDLHGKLSNDELVVPQGAVDSGDYKVGGNNTLQLFVSHSNGTWEKVNDIPSYSFHNADRDLLLYGNYTADQVAQYEDSFPPFEEKVVC